MKHFTKLSIAKWSLSLCLSFFVFVSCQKEQKLKNVQEEAADIGISSQLANQEDKLNTFKGPEVEVGNGYARTFIIRSHTGEPKELGIVFTNEALSGLPSANTPYVLEFHPKALESTPFKHLALGWNANGHALPGGAFIPSHFDIRFFMMSLEDRLAIPAPPNPSILLLPPAGYMPTNYVADAAIPKLGVHWAPNNFTRGSTISHTMILGSFNGKFSFVSPIVTLTTLASGATISLPYAQPQYFAEHGYYPTTYNIYEDDKKRHYVTLSDFVWR